MSIEKILMIPHTIQSTQNRAVVYLSGSILKPRYCKNGGLHGRIIPMKKIHCNPVEKKIIKKNTIDSDTVRVDDFFIAQIIHSCKE